MAETGNVADIPPTPSEELICRLIKGMGLPCWWDHNEMGSDRMYAGKNPDWYTESGREAAGAAPSAPTGGSGLFAEDRAPRKNAFIKNLRHHHGFLRFAVKPALLVGMAALLVTWLVYLFDAADFKGVLGSDVAGRTDAAVDQLKQVESRIAALVGEVGDLGLSKRADLVAESKGLLREVNSMVRFDVPVTNNLEDNLAAVRLKARESLQVTPKRMTEEQSAAFIDQANRLRTQFDQLEDNSTVNQLKEQFDLIDARLSELKTISEGMRQGSNYSRALMHISMTVVVITLFSILFFLFRTASGKADRLWEKIVSLERARDWNAETLHSASAFLYTAGRDDSGPAPAPGGGSYPGGASPLFGQGGPSQGG